MYTFESKSLLALRGGESVPARPVAPPELAELVDLAGYDLLGDFIRSEGLDRLPGDFLEIGCFLGGGTAKLAKLAASVGKQVWVVDIFDPSFDLTPNLSGDRMADIYQSFLKGRTQEEIFRQATAPWSSVIHILKQDSMKVRFPQGLRFAFAFIDGNHDPRWVKSDFELALRRLEPGGWAGFHDYRGDLPQVTAALDEMIDRHAGEIARIEMIKERWILLVQKRPCPRGEE